jgi:hypothetical protein
MQDLGTRGYPESFATAVNRSGVVVGTVDDENNEDLPRPFIFFGGTMRFLDRRAESGSLVLVEPTSINNSRQIVGTAFLGDELHGVLLTPITG